MSQKEVFKPSDFMLDPANAIAASNAANKVLNSKLVKYYGDRELGTEFLIISKDQEARDTLTLYGFEPEPLARDEKSVTVTRKQLRDVLFNRCLTDNKQFQAIAEELGL